MHLYKLRVLSICGCLIEENRESYESEGRIFIKTKHASL
jgi:hypothetical protein